MNCEEFLANIIIPLYDKVALHVGQSRASFFGFSEFLTGLAFLFMVWVTSNYAAIFRQYVRSISLV